MKKILITLLYDGEIAGAVLVIMIMAFAGGFFVGWLCAGGE